MPSVFVSWDRVSLSPTSRLYSIKASTSAKLGNSVSYLVFIGKAQSVSASQFYFSSIYADWQDLTWLVLHIWCGCAHVAYARLRMYPNNWWYRSRVDCWSAIILICVCKVPEYSGRLHSPCAPPTYASESLDSFWFLSLVILSLTDSLRTYLIFPVACLNTCRNSYSKILPSWIRRPFHHSLLFPPHLSLSFVCFTPTGLEASQCSIRTFHPIPWYHGLLLPSS
jgi:hypothetical protein